MDAQIVQWATWRRRRPVARGGAVAGVAIGLAMLPCLSLLLAGALYAGVALALLGRPWTWGSGDE